MAEAFANLSGETLTKNPGDLAGAPFGLSGLDGCTVTLLDFTTSITVENCTNCKILIGPTSSASFQNCSGCTFMVACGEFVATGCADSSFGLYSASAPSLDSCSNLAFACWNAAYPGLNEQFQSAGLSPETNQWKEVNDMSEGEGMQNYQVNEFAPADYWEVPVEGMGEVENPVPAPVASAFNADNDVFFTPPPADEDPFGAPAPAAEGDSFSNQAVVDSFSGAGSGTPLGDEFAAQPLGDEFAAQPLGDEFSAPEPVAAPPPPEVENPKAAEMREAMRMRLRKVDEDETRVKDDLTKEAQSYLEMHYKNREEANQRRKKNNREAEQLTGSQESTGGSYWERIIDYIDFATASKQGVDMSRYKTVLFAAKSKNVPVHVSS